MLLEGKVAVITGGGRGIGRAIATRFAAEGAAVLIASRTEAELRKVAKEIEAVRGKAVWVTADVSREADCAHIVAAARASLSTVILPARNRKDYEDIPESARNSLRFVWAERVEDVIEAALEPATQHSPAMADVAGD